MGEEDKQPDPQLKTIRSRIAVNLPAFASQSMGDTVLATKGLSQGEDISGSRCGRF
ncbi:MAG: hypothetical protein IPK32_26210 [Verrucomicrobiaceae bacterium]|nr:hypothetical protein [Verrucomicrobiaceae bacterium]